MNINKDITKDNLWKIKLIANDTILNMRKNALTEAQLIENLEEIEGYILDIKELIQYAA